jgi:hypothetical protein
VAVLVDAADYFLALRDALELAQDQVQILGWDFDANVILDPLGEGPASRPLREYLPDLLERRPRLHIRLLIWVSPCSTDRARARLPSSIRAGPSTRA